jgi:1-acyl-sn-glycerol-3-phosphate acyltransferase
VLRRQLIDAIFQRARAASSGRAAARRRPADEEAQPRAACARAPHGERARGPLRPALVYGLCKLVLTPLVWFYCRPRVSGRGHIPRTGPVIIASNHLAEIDSLCLGLVVPRPITFLAKHEYFIRGGLLGRVVGWVMRNAGQIPVDRADPSASPKALAAAGSVLDAGGVWAIYPEGTRSADGRLYRGKTGAMRVALSHDCTVVPVTLAGTERISRWRPTRVTVTFGPPLDLAPYAGVAADRAAVRAATDMLMATLQRQGGAEYVDSYAPRGAAAKR